MPGCAPKCSLPARTLSTHAHAVGSIVISQQSDPVRLRSSAIVHYFFFLYYSLMSCCFFPIFSIQSGCDRSRWVWSLVWRLRPGKLIPLKHLHVTSRPDVGPTYVDSKLSLWIIWWVNWKEVWIVILVTCLHLPCHTQVSYHLFCSTHHFLHTCFAIISFRCPYLR